jgi:hypothetical protein
VRGYEQHESVPLIVEDPQPDPLTLMRELAALTREEEVPPPVTSYPSSLSVRRSRLAEAVVDQPVTTSAEWSDRA